MIFVESSVFSKSVLTLDNFFGGFALCLVLWSALERLIQHGLHVPAFLVDLLVVMVMYQPNSPIRATSGQQAPLKVYGIAPNVLPRMQQISSYIFQSSFTSYSVRPLQVK
jgi:hypothetical protein